MCVDRDQPSPTSLRSLAFGSPLPGDARVVLASHLINCVPLLSPSSSQPSKEAVRTTPSCTANPLNQNL